MLLTDPKFANMKAADMEILIDSVTTKHFSGGTTLLSKQENIEFIYLMIEGVLMEMNTNKIVCDESKLWGYDFINHITIQKIGLVLIPFFF